MKVNMFGANKLSGVWSVVSITEIEMYAPDRFARALEFYHWWLRVPLIQSLVFYGLLPIALAGLLAAASGCSNELVGGLVLGLIALRVGLWRCALYGLSSYSKHTFSR